MTGPQASMMSARAASGAMESGGAVDHGADLVVQSLVASIAEVSGDRGGEAVAAGTDCTRGFDEFRDA